MKISFYHIDAFTDRLFSGNPAAVCILQEWLADDALHAIAKENNLPATAFLVREDKKFHIRWITPEYELDLCGHGSLAAGYVILNFIEPTWQQVDLYSRKEVLPIQRTNDFITLNFPVKNMTSYYSEILEIGLGLSPQEIYTHQSERCLAVYKTEAEVRQLQPNMAHLKKMEHLGIIVTAPAEKVDFVSRTFYPKKNISEDPATGASHCLLAPYWSQRLGKQNLHAQQLSERGGEIFCECKDERVFISGKAVLYAEGILHI